MEKRAKNLKNAKNWNMVLFIFGIIGSAIGLISLKSVGQVSPEVAKILGKEITAIYKSPIYITQQIVSVIISVALTVLYFLANRKLKAGIAAPKYPYYINIAWKAISLVISFSMLSSMYTSATIISTVATTLITCIPALLVIIFLFKAEPEE